ncbi:hypothetical protein [Indibacter alkaliphilus]|nr:hypothetical protein [Indibacter alkaliphilus]
MKNSLIIAILISLVFISCESFGPELEFPVLEKEKKVLFEFFTDKDYSATQFDSYFVNLNVGVSLVDKITAEEIRILKESTGMIPFKEIPDELNKIRFEIKESVDIHRYHVSFGYSHYVRIGETFQMKAISEFLPDKEDEKLVVIKF